MSISPLNKINNSLPDKLGKSPKMFCRLRWDIDNRDILWEDEGDKKAELIMSDFERYERR